MRACSGAPPSGVEHTASLSSALCSVPPYLRWTFATRVKKKSRACLCFLHASRNGLVWAVNNIREMTAEHRTFMLSELIPFVAAFLSELLRAVATGIAQSEREVIEVPVDEDDESAMLQLPEQGCVEMGFEDTVLMQTRYDPAVPFGSRLSQLQAHLNGMNDGQSAQVAVHLQTMIGRLRQLAGDLLRQHRDRFERLEALVATYVDECESTPLSLQVWGEHQLKALVPYLGGGAGKTPETSDREERGSGAASSTTDVVVVENSSGVAVEDEVPEFRVR